MGLKTTKKKIRERERERERERQRERERNTYSKNTVLTKNYISYSLFLQIFESNKKQSEK
jgi:hypothetical protein